MAGSRNWRASTRIRIGMPCNLINKNWIRGICNNPKWKELSRVVLDSWDHFSNLKYQVSKVMSFKNAMKLMIMTIILNMILLSVNQKNLKIRLMSWETSDKELKPILLYHRNQISHNLMIKNSKILELKLGFWCMS